MHYQGPAPCISLKQGEKLNILNTSDKQNLTFGTDPAVLYSFGLSSCASVIYVSTDPGALACAYVHHANCGLITISDIGIAIESLYPKKQDGKRPSIDSTKIYVVYAHPGSNVLYEKEIEKLLGFGIPLHNIIEIEELPTNSFGIDNNGFIGCVVTARA